MASHEDVNGDGLLDLIVHVDTESLVLCEADTEARMEAKTFGGESIIGSDVIRVVP
jgi:hypothetical protein